MKFFARKTLDYSVKIEEWYDESGRQIFFSSETSKKKGRIMVFKFDKPQILFDKEIQTYHGYNKGEFYTRTVTILAPLKK